MLSVQQCKYCLDALCIPSLTEEDRNISEGLTTSGEVLNALKSMSKDKSPGNDGLMGEFYIQFYNMIENVFIQSVNHSHKVIELSSSQKQVVITLTEKKDKDIRHIKNWRPISLLNVDTKIISKVLATRLKKVICELVTQDQTAYIAGRYTGESVRLISDILEYTDRENCEGYMFAADIEKAFDSPDHNFILAVLAKMGLGSDFVRWVRTLLNDQLSCVVNNGTTTGYFKLNRGTRQNKAVILQHSQNRPTGDRWLKF